MDVNVLPSINKGFFLFLSFLFYYLYINLPKDLGRLLACEPSWKCPCYRPCAVSSCRPSDTQSNSGFQLEDDWTVFSPPAECHKSRLNKNLQKG